MKEEWGKEEHSVTGNNSSIQLFLESQVTIVYGLSMENLLGDQWRAVRFLNGEALTPLSDVKNIL